MGQCLSVLNFLMSPKEGASELSYQLAQMRREGEMRKLHSCQQASNMESDYYERVRKNCMYFAEWFILAFEVCLFIGNVGCLIFM